MGRGEAQQEVLRPAHAAALGRGGDARVPRHGDGGAQLRQRDLSAARHGKRDARALSLARGTLGERRKKGELPREGRRVDWASGGASLARDTVCALRCRFPTTRFSRVLVWRERGDLRTRGWVIGRAAAKVWRACRETPYVRYAAASPTARLPRAHRRRA